MSVLFDTVPDLVTCASHNFTWTSDPSPASFNISSLQIVTSNSSLGPELLSLLSEFDPSPEQQELGRLAALAQNVPWNPVNVPPGQYQLILHVDFGPESGFSDATNIFNVVQGSDTSCTNISIPDPGPGLWSGSGSGSGSTGKKDFIVIIAVPIILGLLFIIITSIVLRYLYLRRRRHLMPERIFTRNTSTVSELRGRIRRLVRRTVARLSSLVVRKGGWKNRPFSILPEPDRFSESLDNSVGSVSRNRSAKSTSSSTTAESLTSNAATGAQTLTPSQTRMNSTCTVYINDSTSRASHMATRGGGSISVFSLASGSRVTSSNIPMPKLQDELESTRGLTSNDSDHGVSKGNEREGRTLATEAGLLV